MIEHYRFGLMQIGGQSYQHDLKIIDGRIIGDWFRKQGHLMLVDDIADVLLAVPSILVIGQGSSGFMQIAPEVTEVLTERQIDWVSQPTAEAVKTFNYHHQRDRNVAGAFHLTC